MELLQERVSFDDKIREMMFSLRYKDNPIVLVGSASLSAQQYSADFDFVSAISRNDTPDQIYNEFNKILEKIDKDPDLYFLELKIQTKDEQKFRYYRGQKLSLDVIKKHHQNIDFIKIDMSAWFDYTFSDCSVIYSLFGNKLSPEEYKDSVREEIKEYAEEGNYYKVLKRKFLVYKIDEDVPKLRELTHIFNSDLGRKYKIASNIEAIILVLDSYDDKLTRERAKINLKSLHLEHVTLDGLRKAADSMETIINKKAKKLNKHFPI